jgi:folate-binding protein YgfZ
MFLDSKRQVFQITGKDRYRFLQGLITQDINILEKGLSKAIYTALLTPTGRYQFDFFIVNANESLYLVSTVVEALLERIQPYKLRLDVQLIPLSDTYKVYGSFQAFSTELSFQDPRHSALGYWLISDQPLVADRTYQEYIHHRFHLGIPEGEDFEIDRSIILEWGLEELNGISFTKGCYMGQELMSRTKHLGQIRKRILPLQFDDIHGDITVGDKITYNGTEIGNIKAVHNYLALGLIRIDMISIREEATVPVSVNDDKAIIYKPEWITI